MTMMPNQPAQRIAAAETLSLSDVNDESPNGFPYALPETSPF